MLACLCDQSCDVRNAVSDAYECLGVETSSGLVGQTDWPDRQLTNRQTDRMVL